MASMDGREPDFSGWKLTSGQSDWLAEGYDINVAGTAVFGYFYDSFSLAKIGPDSNPLWAGAFSAGGMLSTARDQAAWIRDLVQGSVLDVAHRDLRLMQQGQTLEGASRRLGINPRTGRRRIAAAMKHYEAPTLFALGTAWTAAGAGHAGASGG